MELNKNKRKNPGVSTRAIHHGRSFAEDTGCIMPPIFTTSTFEYGNKENFDYTRSGNPNFQILEGVLKSIESASYCTVFNSGISAVTAIVSSLKSGDKILCESNLYGCTIRMFEKVFQDFGIETYYYDFTSQDNLEKIAEINPTLIWLESPTNPLLKVLNIEKICKVANEYTIPVVVDNTFCTSIIQKPLELGATISLLSTTKFINGHSDALGGAVLTNSNEWYQKMIFSQKALGLHPSPFDCWLITRGLKTLPLRIEKQCQNAEIIANKLSSHKFINKLIYPFHKSHPQFNFAKKQMNLGGSMISMKLNFNKKQTFNFCKKLKYFSLAESLGGVESLICHPASMTHASVDKRTKTNLGIDDSLVRLSVGCEDINDLLTDILLSLEDL
tara:strand:- start:10758 stop:11921 length:1164 start_codon:yes stop_codon:yes gene_type:complete